MCLDQLVTEDVADTCICCREDEHDGACVCMCGNWWIKAGQVV